MRKSIVPVALASAVAASVAAAGCASSAPAVGSVTPQQQLETLKSLEGTWRSVPGSGMEGTIVYHVVGAGSAVEERIFPGTPHEMVTLYHLDGPSQLVLTHYCAAGNQPSMRAVPSDDPSSIRFEFVRLSNGDPAKDMHMHEGALTLGADGHLRSTWQSWEDGKPGGFRAELELVRAQ